MTTQEFIAHQLDDGTFQLAACLDSLPEGEFDRPVTPEGMSARETVIHLCECYEAFIASTEGREHAWGTYEQKDQSKDGLLAAWRSQRARALDAARAHLEAAPHIHAYLIAHDCYHVGQLCLIRLAVDPAWDPYSIYRMDG